MGEPMSRYEFLAEHLEQDTLYAAFSIAAMITEDDLIKHNETYGKSLTLKRFRLKARKMLNYYRTKLQDPGGHIKKGGRYTEYEAWEGKEWLALLKT